MSDTVAWTLFVGGVVSLSVSAVLWIYSTPRLGRRRRPRSARVTSSSSSSSSSSESERPCPRPPPPPPPPPPAGSPGMSPQGSPGTSPQGSPGMSPQGSPGMSPQGSPGMSPQVSPGMSPQASPGPSPQPSPEMSPPPPVTPDVFGVSVDPTATAIYNNAPVHGSSFAPFVVQLLPDLSPTPVSPLINPNYVPMAFSGNYNAVLSLSQGAAGSPPVNGFTLDVMVPGPTSTVTRSLFTPTNVTFQAVALATNVSAGVNHAFVACTEGLGAKATMATASLCFQFSEILPGQYGPGVLFDNVPGNLQDMRVSSDNNRLVFVTGIIRQNNVHLYDISGAAPLLIAVIRTADAAYDYQSPPMDNNLIAVSAAFTPDNQYVLVALTGGTTGPDRVLRFSQIDGSFQGVAVSSIPQDLTNVAVKIICSGKSYVVGRQGPTVTTVDTGDWSVFPPVSGTIPGLLDAGVTDILNFPAAPLGSDRWAILYQADGAEWVQSRDGIISRLSRTNGVRLGFARTNDKQYWGRNDGTAAITAVNVFDATPERLPVPGTATNTWYVTGCSSADYSGTLLPGGSPGP